MADQEIEISVRNGVTLLIASKSSQSTPRFLARLFRTVLPLARQELQYWTSLAEQIPDAVLRHEALQSLQHKRFHADGGCVYAASDHASAAGLVRLIVALQTISDYLDNLCDRASTLDPADFRQLHHAMRDAVRPDAPVRDYYALRSHRNDGGYLTQLVSACQAEIRKLPGYSVAEPYVCWLIERYSELQEHKHVALDARQSRLEGWTDAFLQDYPELDWWEWSAATGSTLAVFALFTAAAEPLSDADAKMVFDAYFPWVCGLHILLDYLIDLEEDAREQDFNFVECYPDTVDLAARFTHFVRTGLQQVTRLTKDATLHRHVVKGLLSMYLSDQKAHRQARVRPLRRLVWQFGPKAWVFYGACKLYRIVR